MVSELKGRAVKRSHCNNPYIGLFHAKQQFSPLHILKCQFSIFNWKKFFFRHCGRIVNVSAWEISYNSIYTQNFVRQTKNWCKTPVHIELPSFFYLQPPSSFERAHVSYSKLPCCIYTFNLLMSFINYYYSSYEPRLKWYNCDWPLLFQNK